MNKLSVLSYNVWFDNTLETERVTSLITTVSYHDPDVLCLQEVKPNIYAVLIKNLKNYKYHYPSKISFGYGCVILSKLPITKTLSCPFASSQMGRILEIVKTDYPYQSVEDDGIGIEKRQIIIATTHFESIFQRASPNTEKLNQFKESHTVLNQVYNMFKNVIFCADTNILPSEEKDFIPTESTDVWADSWKLVGSPNEKFTYDGDENIYLQLKACSYRNRLDRILFRTDNCEIDSFQLVKGLDGLTEPSDHFGVLSRFTVI